MPTIVLIARMLLGWSWLEQGIFKFQAGFTIDGLPQSLQTAAGVPDWYKVFMLQFVAPNAGIYNIVVPLGEVLVGLGLIAGVLSLPALLASGFMLLNYWLADMVYIYPIQIAVLIVLLLLNHYDQFKTIRLTKFLNPKWGKVSQSRWF